MLESIESDHRECLTEKVTLNAKISGLEQKLSVVEE